MTEINRLAFSIGKLGINVMERLFKAAVHIHGVEEIPDGVILFVVNHFTRLETLILAYEFYKLTGKRGVDVIVDNVGAATINTSMRAVTRGGRIVIVGNTSGPQAEIDIRYIFGKQISLIGSTMGSHQDFLEVTALLWAGKLKPVIDRVMPLSEGREAFAVMERGDHFGKIVLQPCVR